MTSQSAKDYIPLVTALAEGKTIQIQGREWIDCPNGVSFECPSQFYRIKPEPRRWWLAIGNQTIDVYPARESAMYHAPTKTIIEVVEVMK